MVAMHSPRTAGRPLGSAARSVWAKYRRLDGASLPLWRHLDDTASVAGRLWGEWLPDLVRRTISSALPEGQEDGRRLACWLACVHDVGKATPAFATQVPELAERMRRNGLDMPTVIPHADRKRARHATAGHVVLEDWLVERNGWDKEEAQQYAVVVGGHHGVPPTRRELLDARERPWLLSSEEAPQAWRSVQEELLEWAAERSGARDRLTAWRDVLLPQTAQVLLTAVVIVADWIASNDELFPYGEGGSGPGADRLADAWTALDLPAPWQASPGGASGAALFTSRFTLPAGAEPRPVQRDVVELARTMPAPGLLIVEAPMGEGKTEAALAAVEIAAARSGAGGCFVALPTMATSDAMAGRVLAWLERLPGASVDGAYSVFLAHSKAHLNTEFRSMVKRGDFRQVGVDETIESGAGGPDHGLVAHQWLSGRKKGVLSSFVIGTIDQLLFGSLMSRHLALRHLALAGKVIVIDEAHAYDVYMSVYLDRIMEWLGAYSVPVIVLSATLPAHRRRALAAAYQAGAAGGGSKRRRSTADTGPLDGEIGYPAVTAAAPGHPVEVRVSAPSGRGIPVRLERIDDTPQTLVTELTAALSEGGCAAVVRNTVARVQETAAYLREAFGDDTVMVCHSRFLAPDRAENDRELLDLFGAPERLAKNGTERPPRRIVVASQVVEQSLDVDFDLVVTDLAPVDLVLQRMGRLHRHPRARPPGVRRARCLIAGVDWDAAPPEPVRGSRTVYGEHALLRSLAALWPHLDTEITLPGAIAPLVRDAYGPAENGPEEWRPEMERAAREHRERQAAKQEEARAFLLARTDSDGEPVLGWLRGGVGDAEDTQQGRAQVRDTGESLEVLVAVRSGDAVALPRWLTGYGGKEIPTEQPPPAGLARAVASCSIRLPYQLTASPAVIDAVIDDLEASWFGGWQQSSWLKDQLVMVLDEDHRCHLAGFDVAYDRRDGLTVMKRD